MKFTLHCLNKIIDAVGWVCVIALLLMIFNVFIDVFIRYVIVDILVYLDAYSWYNKHLSWLGGIPMQELEWHWFSIMFLLGLGYTLRENGHVRVDVFYDRFSERTKSWVNIIGALIFTLPFCLLIAYYSSEFFWNSFISGENIGNPGSLPRLWPIKLILPLAFLFLVLSTFAVILKEILALSSDSDNEEVQS